jgi:dipeptidyl aminopeptidase/acylaminoacyl peptidase
MTLKSLSLSLILAIAAAAPASLQEGQQSSRQASSEMNRGRAERLYVSVDPRDHSIGYNFQRDLDAKKETDRRYAEITKGVVDYQKITYRSSVGDLDIPAYLFQPLKKRGAKGHPALVWVHGGVHGNRDLRLWQSVTW